MQLNSRRGRRRRTLRARLVLAASLALCCCSVTGCTGAGVIGDATIERWLADGPRTPTSYVTPNANGTQNGRVPLAYQPLGELTQVASLAAPKDAAGAPVDPATVLLPERAGYVVIDYGPGVSYEIRTRPAGSGNAERVQSAHSSSFTSEPQGPVSVALEDGIIVGAELVGYVNPERPLSRTASSQPLATAVIGQFMITADLTAPIARPGESVTSAPWGLHAGLKRRSEGGWEQLWYFTEGGPDRVGCAAIDPSGQVAIAAKDGQLHIVGPEGTKDGRASGKVERKIAYSPYFISSVDGQWILLEPRRPPPVVPQLTGLETFADLVARARVGHEERTLTFTLYVDPRRSTLDWKTGVIALDGQGADVWAAEVPFRVLSPAIALGQDTVLLVGNGVAALQRGNVLWSRGSAQPLWATAFADGTIALSAGRELQILGRDGRDKQTLRTPEDQPITTAPAIGADGSVWVATRQGLYVARPQSSPPSPPAPTAAPAVP